MSHGIHSIGDFNNSRRPDPSRSVPDSGVPSSILGYGTNLGTPEAIRRESFWDMLTYIFCPFFYIRSFIFLITIVDLVVYLLMIVTDFNTGKFLQPTVDALEMFGAKDAYKMQQEFEVWRWVTPVLLHASLGHLLYNLVMQMIIGFRLEPTVKWLVTAKLYFLSGCGGVLLSAVGAPQTISVGASAAIFGLIAATVRFIQIAYLLAKWEELEGDRNLSMTMIWLVVLLFLNLLMAGVRITQGSANVDNWAHFGGIIVGFGAGFISFLPARPSPCKKTLKFLAQVGLFVYFLGGLLLFFTAVQTSPTA